jgi:hypothetical protein
MDPSPKRRGATGALARLAEGGSAPSAKFTLTGACTMAKIQTMRILFNPLPKSLNFVSNL